MHWETWTWNWRTADQKSRVVGRNVTTGGDMLLPFRIDNGDIPVGTKIVQIMVNTYYVYYLSEIGELFGSGRRSGNANPFENLYGATVDYARRVAKSHVRISWLGESRGCYSHSLIQSGYTCDGIIPTSPTVCKGDDGFICIGKDNCLCIDGRVEPKGMDPIAIIIIIFVPIIIVLLFLFILFVVLCGFCCFRSLKLKDVDGADVALKTLEKNAKKSVLKGYKIDKSVFKIKYNHLKVLKCLEEEKLGSVVYHCFYQNEEVAFKSFKFNLFPNQSTLDIFTKESMCNMKLVHKNIAKNYGCTYQSSRIGYVTELGTVGNLGEVLKGKTPELSKGDKVKIFFEVASALEYLTTERKIGEEEISMVHGALKLENIILFTEKIDPEKEKGKKEKKPDIIAKICDFGYVKTLEDMPKELKDAIYTAPELFKGENPTEKTDVWAFAVCVFQAFTNDVKPYGKEPLKKIEYKACNQSSFRPDFSKVSPSWVSELIEQAMSENPDDRPSFKEIKEKFEKHVPKKSSPMDLLAKVKGMSKAKVEEKKEDIELEEQEEVKEEEEEVNEEERVEEEEEKGEDET